jgi:hypothetical protein
MFRQWDPTSRPQPTLKEYAAEIRQGKSQQAILGPAPTAYSSDRIRSAWNKEIRIDEKICLINTYTEGHSEEWWKKFSTKLAKQIGETLKGDLPVGAPLRTRMSEWIAAHRSTVATASVSDLEMRDQWWSAKLRGVLDANPEEPDTGQSSEVGDQTPT